LALVVVSLTGAAKLESFGPDPPANPLPKEELNALPLPSPPKPDVVEPPPNPKPNVGLSPIVVVVVVVVGDLELANPPNPDEMVWALLPNTLGCDAPIAPKGEEAEEARDAKPEFAKAEVDVCALSPNVLPNIGLGGGRGDLFEDSAVEATGCAESPELISWENVSDAKFIESYINAQIN
jgi:hypothetical protein